MPKVPNQITKQLILCGKPEDVWNSAFGSAEALCSWLPERIEGEFCENGRLTLIWGNHRSDAILCEFNPPNSLAFQWHPGDAYTIEQLPESQLTTVRIELNQHIDDTQITLTETGFENIPEEKRQWAYDQNNSGWDEELEKLKNRN